MQISSHAQEAWRLRACFLVVEEAVVDAAGEPEAPVEGHLCQDVRAAIRSARPVAAACCGSAGSRRLYARYDALSTAQHES